jgi:hypothetical protein
VGVSGKIKEKVKPIPNGEEPDVEPSIGKGLLIKAC